MAFLLRDIERQLPGELVDLGRSLYEKHAVGSLFEVDKHLWTGLVRENKAFEVEVQISPSKVKAYTCDCGDYQQEKICKHIVAFLFRLREKIVFEKLNKAQSQPPVQKKKYRRKLSINAVLENASEQNLKEFIRAYARSNRPFSLALKAHFAINVPMDDSTQKYADLVNTTVKSVTVTKKRLSPTGKNRIGWLIDHLVAHWDTAFNQKNYREALSITFATFDYLFPLRYKEIEDEKSFGLLERLSKCFTWLESLMHSDMGPQLREELYIYLEEKVQKASWLQQALKDDFLERILNISPEKIRLKYLDTLQETILLLNNEPPIGPELILIGLRLQSSITLPDSALNLHYSPALIESLLNKLSIPDDCNIQKRLASIGLQLQAEPDFLLNMKKSLLEVALIENDAEQAIELSRSLFYATGEMDYYQVLKEKLPKSSNLLTSTLQELELRPNSMASKMTIAQLYRFEEQWEQLFQLLEEEADLDFLIQIDQDIPTNKRSRLDPIYEKALRTYLSSYLGRPAAKKVSKLFHHLNQKNAHRLSRHLLDIIKKEFKEWKAVQQSLSGMKF